MPRSGGGMGGGMGGGFGGGGGRGGGFSGGGRSGGRSGGGMGGRSGGAGRMGGSSGGGMGGRPPGGGMPRGGGGSGAGGFFTGMLLGNMMGSNRGGGGGPRPPQEPRNDNQNGGGGFGSGCAVIIIAIVLIIVVFGLFGVMTSDGCSSSSADVPASTVEREPLKLGTIDPRGYYTDVDGDWISNPNTLESGMKTFYNETGVQPYLYILPNGEETSTSQLSSTAEELYSELFGGEDGHFLLVFCDNNYGGFNCGYWFGNSVGTVMDNEAIEILGSYLDYYYYTATTEDVMFSDTFSDTAKRIMSRTTQPIDLVVPIVICIVIVIVAIIIFVTLRRRRQHETEERERTERILSTPLEKYGDSDLEELEKKYEKSSSNVNDDVKVTTSGSTKEAEEEDPLKTYGDKDVEDLAKEYEEKDGESQTGDE